MARHGAKGRGQGSAVRTGSSGAQRSHGPALALGPGRVRFGAQKPVRYRGEHSRGHPAPPDREELTCARALTSVAPGLPRPAAGTGRRSIAAVSGAWWAPRGQGVSSWKGPPVVAGRRQGNQWAAAEFRGPRGRRRRGEWMATGREATAAPGVRREPRGARAPGSYAMPPRSHYWWASTRSSDNSAGIVLAPRTGPHRSSRFPGRGLTVEPLGWTARLVTSAQVCCCQPSRRGRKGGRRERAAGA